MSDESPAAAPEAAEPPKKRKYTKEELLARFGGGHRAAHRSIAQIIVAMLNNNCDVGKAAVELKISPAYLQNKIYKNKDLKARFGAEAMRMRAIAMADAHDKAKLRVDLRSNVFEHKMDEFVVGQSRISQMILDRLVEVQERIKNGGKVKRMRRLYNLREIKTYTEADKEFMAEWEYEEGEEKMMLNHELVMIQEYARAGEVTASLAYRKVQTQSLIKKMGGKVATNEQPPKPKAALASTPKGMAPAIPPPRLQPKEPEKALNGNSATPTGDTLRDNPVESAPESHAAEGV